MQYCKFYTNLIKNLDLPKFKTYLLLFCKLQQLIVAIVIIKLRLKKMLNTPNKTAPGRPA